MAERELFQIGEVAKMYHLSVGTLRHYEQVGLLKPEYTDPATGYRYYSVRQFEQLTNIRYLRALGLPRDEIAATLHDRDVDNIAEALRRQKELIARKKQELEIMERKIDHRLAQLEDARRSELDCIRLVEQDARRSELDCIRLVEQPALRLVLLRDSVKFNSYLWLERSIRKIEQDQKLPLSYIGKVGVGISEENLKSAEFGHYDLVFLVLEEDDVYEGRVETLPPCRCAAVQFRGDHSRAPQYYEQLAQFLAANGLQIAGFSREITLIDNCISDDPAQYVTEIRIPVARG